MTGGRAPIGRVTRGTTGTNRLRRVDRWIARHPALRRSDDPLVVDLGYGARGWTTLELWSRISPVHPAAEVVGLEIDPARVDRAREELARVRAGETSFARDARVRFDRGGFEVVLPNGRRPAVIRAMNVLRQYDETEVVNAWERMTARLQPGGVLVEGTCDERGRIATWVAVDDTSRPRTLTISLRLADLERPGVVAERLPKALIHRNVPGERIHDVLRAADDEWERAAGLAPFGPVQRWEGALRGLQARGVEILDRRRWRLGEMTVPWETVAPR
ncbi:class I SAM-dependent methyltransferase [Microbacterium sp. ET2]|uniref:class I SAM-dependent methyltransferase n=1 Tax=Microbacterium albipurpureum TaxID=3050384 RepID=UPI00259D1898|nr:class I SAM-dependent methyltransferase [Microbacterium sp. ET2 (Ac-2212)]WJL96196.1 class I SAM-dependent methyltransferase [Microbacterium sp. ET2 (Ac-2212)]